MSETTIRGLAAVTSMVNGFAALACTAGGNAVAGVCFMIAAGAWAAYAMARGA